MSKIKVQQPILHLPSFKEYKISGADLANKYEELDIEMPFPRSDFWYYYSNPEGWAKVLADLTITSGLYKKDRFDCEDYALKAQVMCAERYGLNTLRYTYGKMPLGYHGFNSFWAGDRIMLFEPNEGFVSYLDGNLVFELGDNSYEPKTVLI